MLSDTTFQHKQRGVLLLESLIAILIFSLGVLAIMGLQAATMKATTSAKARVDASLVANERIAQIWIDRANIASYAESNTAISDLPGGKRTTLVNSDEVTVTVNWTMPGDSTQNTFITIARINGN